MKLILKGFIIGLGKVIPGVSGAMLAISLGIYEEIIEKISKLKKEYKNSTRYLIKPLIGIILAIVLTSKIIVKCLDRYYLPTMLLFIGMIIGGMPQLIKQINRKKLRTKEILISITLLILITIYINKITIETNHQINYSIIEFIKLIGIGVIDSAASIIPGISGTALLMILGYYDVILTTFGTLNEITKIQQNIFILIPFMTGFILGILIISKVINKIIKTKKETVYLITTIFMIITLIKLTKTSFVPNQHPITYLIGIILLILGINIGIKLNKKIK